mmetsp:Transcript_11284/g.23998  ORF Transcript_11284/g.23998 Transcript_11284/m.23998 type:complete len:223 (-) Transcript_11284:256-924(-)
MPRRLTSVNVPLVARPVRASRSHDAHLHLRPTKTRSDPMLHRQKLWRVHGTRSRGTHWHRCPVSDEGLSESAKEILALLPVGCTWAHAALARGHLIGRCHDPVAMNDVLQRLPACEPVHRRFCLEQNIESAKEIRDFLKTVESTQVTLAWDRIVQLLAEGGVVNPHWYVDRYDSDEPWEWNCHRDVLVSIPKLVGDVVDAAVEGHEEPKSAWEILKQYCDVV